MKSLLGPRLLIENVPEETEKKLESGVLIPVTVNKPKKGKVFQVGLTVRDEIKKLGGEQIKAGDDVLYEPNEYAQITIGEKSYDTILLDSLICVL